jgi:hypothetical protein
MRLKSIAAKHLSATQAVTSGSQQLAILGSYGSELRALLEARRITRDREKEMRALHTSALAGAVLREWRGHHGPAVLGMWPGKTAVEEE